MTTRNEATLSLNLYQYPLSYSRFRLAFEWIKELLPPRAKTLDVGCLTGEFARCLAGEGYFAFGIDINRTAIGYASRIPADGAFFFWYKGGRFPFENGTFDGVTLLDVLECVVKEDMIIREVHRVLKKDGLLICSVPHQSRYASLDPENFKFRFPQAHKNFYTLLGQRRVYLQKYHQDPAVFGVFARGHPQGLWHRHYSRSQLESLWGADFTTLRVHRGGGLPFLLGYLGNKVWFRFFRCYLRPFSQLMAKDFIKDHGDNAYNLQILMKKI